MEASKLAIGRLLKTVNWFQPTCAIVMRQIFQCIGRLFHQLEQTDNGKLIGYLEECFKVPLAALRQMQLDNLRSFNVFFKHHGH